MVFRNGTFLRSGEKDIKELAIPCGFIKIGSSAFKGCSLLKNITIPNSGDNEQELKSS